MTPILLALLLLVAANPALAADRIDLYDTHGRREGYATIDRETGRVDYYAVNSRRTGWGRVEPSGRAERFDLQGQRQPSTALPAWTPPATKPPR